MFRVQCFVEDKKLAMVLRGLKGIAYNVEAVPVDETPRKATNGSIGAINLKGRKTIDRDEMKKILTAMGRSAASCNYAIKELIKAGRLRGPKGKGSQSYYEVV
jgi:hypothetical protein